MNLTIFSDTKVVPYNPFPWTRPHEKKILPPSEIYDCGWGSLMESINTTQLLEIDCCNLTLCVRSVSDSYVSCQYSHQHSVVWRPDTRVYSTVCSCTVLSAFCWTFCCWACFVYISCRESGVRAWLTVRKDVASRLSAGVVSAFARSDVNAACVRLNRHVFYNKSCS